MFSFLGDHILLTVFLVIALGAAFGAISFGPIRFGAAGALFVGLAFGAFIPDPAPGLAVFQNLGLALFVYLVGLEAGESFFKDFKQQFGLMLTSIVAIAIGAAAAVLTSSLLGLSRELAVGIFAGALTNTPSLSLAQVQTGSNVPAVGYSLGYPVGVIVAILLVFAIIGRDWKAPRDQVNPDDAVLKVARIRVENAMSSKDLVELGGDDAWVSTVRRDGVTHVVGDDDDLRVGDVVTVFATKSVLPKVIRAVGSEVSRSILRDKNVGVHRFAVSNRDLAGVSVRRIPLFDRFGSRITRVRRSDTEFLATSDTYLEVGDIVEVAHPVNRFDDLTAYFGNSIRRMSELDVVAAAGGLSLGFAASLIVIPLPAGASFALGTAAGPLIVGMILGAVRRTGATAWQLPRSANYTLRQFGLMLFLAAVGIVSGPAFASTAFSLHGLTSLLIAAVVGAAGCGAFFLLAYLQGQSPARASGGVAGLLGQPAVLQFALERSSDSRIMAGYGTTFAVSVLVKIIAVPVILAV